MCECVERLRVVGNDQFHNRLPHTISLGGSYNTCGNNSSVLTVLFPGCFTTRDRVREVYMY